MDNETVQMSGLAETQEDDGSTLIERAMATIRQRIAARALTPGSRLPSIRAFAKTMQVSKSTIVEAYERLAAEGVIQARQGSGFFVSAPLAPLSLAEIGPKLDRDVDPLWISRQSLEAGEDVLKPGCGWLPASWMPDCAGRCGRCLAPATPPWPTTIRRSASRRCASSSRGAWPSMASRHRPTRSC